MNPNAAPAPIRIRAKAKEGGTEVLVLMPHPMETGLGTDDAGMRPAAHFITDVRVWCEDRVVMEAKLSIAVAKDPLLSFRFRGGRAGDRIRVMWRDNTGDERTDEARVS